MSESDFVDYEIASVIDHTLLKANVSSDEINSVCEEAKKYGFATVCVYASNIKEVSKLLAGSKVRPIAVVDFPLGAQTAETKVQETLDAIKAGAEEIDMVINIGALKAKDYKRVYEEIRSVVEASSPHKVKVKVILETSDLTEDEKIIGCALAKAAQAAFVKTSTGFGKGGATVHDVALMRKIVGEEMEVKASGGIRTKEDALSMIDAGADRIGASASVAIVTDRGPGPRSSDY